MADRTPAEAAVSVPGRLEAVAWLVVGAVCGFFLSNFVPPLGALAGFVVTAVALIRRRRDRFGYFVLGYIAGFAILMGLFLLRTVTASPSQGSVTSIQR